MILKTAEHDRFRGTDDMILNDYGYEGDMTNSSEAENN